jgi:trimeric autotransporter adhesin
MKRFLYTLVVLLGMTQLVFGQLSGIKNIPGDYATIEAAITALNASGVGAGGVTFNVAAGSTETFSTPLAGTINATGTLANPIIFQKSGAGANPKITAGTPGTGTTDGIIKLAGSDYVTFDGIDLQENAANTTATQQMEWGYAFVKVSGTDGAQNNTIRNCSVTLNKANTASVAIYGGNHIATSTTGLTVTNITGANSVNKIYSNTLGNAYVGISLTGFADATPYAYYDQNNEIGVGGANTITNFGGAATTAYGIYATNQNGIKVANNTINGGNGTTTTLYGIYLLTGVNSNVDIYANTVTINSGATTSTIYAINNAMGGTGTTNVVNIYNNTVQNCTYATSTSGVFYGIYQSSSAFTVNIYGNTVTGNTLPGTSSFYGINGGSGTTMNIYNNTVSNNQKTGASGTMYLTYASNTTVSYHDNAVFNNSIPTTTGTSSASIYGYYNLGSPTSETYYNNSIHDNSIGGTTTGTATIYGLYTNTSSSSVKNYYSNSIYNLSATQSGTQNIYGIYNALALTVNIYKNNIYNFSGNNAGASVYGIYLSSGTTAYIYNNYVSDLKATAGTGTNAINGIYISGGTTVSAFYNTVYLNAVSSSATTFGTSGIYVSTTPTVELRNNNIVNVSTPSGAAYTVAYRRSTTTLTTYAAASNNNNFYAGTPGPNRLIYYDGTNADQTISAFKARVTPRDGSTVTENPPFVNVASTPYDLRIQTTIPTQLESSATTVSTPAITTDFDNTPRFPNPGYPNNILSPATGPDIGANEFAGLYLDAAPPVITFSPLGNTGSLAARTLTATITDGTGVPTGGIGLPVLYWRINTGSYNAATAVSLGGGQYQFTFGAGVAVNDVVYYYVCAQDTYATPNITSNPAAGAGGYSANPPAATTPPTTPYSYNVGSICGVINVGVGQTFTTLTAAVNEYNNKEITCPVTFLLTDATYPSETFPILIIKNSGSSSTNTLTIKPAPGMSPVITGSPATGIIVLYGADNVIIDGSNGAGNTKNLTLENTNSAAMAYVIGVFNDGARGASNCTVKNCLVKASSQVTNSTYGIILNAAGGGYSNIVIDHNTIYSARYAMQFAGIAGNVATNGQVTNNIIGTVTDADAIQYRGIVLSQADNTLISGNEIMGAPAGNSNYSQAALYIMAGSTNTKIRGNKIHDWYYNGTGGWGQYGIYFAGDATTVTEISNNAIYNIRGDGYSASVSSLNVYGIFLSSGGNIKLYENTIDLRGNYTSSTYANWSACVCIYSAASSLLDFRDNIMNNSLQPVSGTPASKTYAIINGSTSAAFTTTNYNDYFVNGIGPNIAYQGGDVATLAAWQTITGQEANSVNINPVFVSGSDLHPTAATLNNLGTYLPTVTTDITGALRTNPPDMGAYEFGLDPIVNTTAASAILSATATINGTINANTATVSSFFDWGPTTTYGTSVAGTPVSVTGSTVTPISTGLIGLTPLTTYHYRARGVTGTGLIIYGPDMTFTTTSPPPTVVTTAATGVTSSDAQLNGTVNANDGSTTVTFEYGLNTSYGTIVAAVPGTVTGNTVTGVSSLITGLLPNNTYHYRIIGVNAGGTSYGLDMTFTTAAAAPIVTTVAASNITTTGAQMNGTVNANYSSTTVTFEYGLNTSYGTIVAATPGTVTGSTPTSVQATLSGLLTNTTYHYRCVGVNAGGTTNGLDMTFLTGCPPVGPAGAVTGPASVCTNSAGNVYSVAPIVNATGYVWLLPAGAVPTAGAGTNTITVTFGSTSGDVSVYGTGPCGNGAQTDYPVTVNPLPVPTITGPATACAGSVGNVYATQAGMTGYLWTISGGGTIVSGQGTSSVTVTWNTVGANSLTVTYVNGNGCAAASPSSYPVTVTNAANPTITGQSSMCVNSGYYYYTTEAGMSNYAWTISGGSITWGQGTNQVQVIWTSPGAQSVSVNYTIGNGCPAPSPTVFPVTVNPMPGAAGTISGTAAVCGGATGVSYSCAAVADAVTYVWTLPAGATIASGSGTNFITVDFAPNASSGDITVYGNNLCGNGTSSPPFPVTVTALPAAAGAITGPSTVCQSVSGVVYTVDPVANATSYTWTVPGGATIVGGGTTNSITVDFSATASSGTITVYGSNSCGDGAVSPVFNVTVNPIPEAPVITVNGFTLESSVATGNQWYFNGAPIPGETGQTYDPTQTGLYWSVVTVNNCSSDTSNNIYYVMIGINENAIASKFSVNPNPNNGQFTVQVEGVQSGKYTLEVINNLGVTIWTSGNIDMSGSYKQTVDIRPVASGIYTVILRNNNNHEVRRVLVNY